MKIIISILILLFTASCLGKTQSGVQGGFIYSSWQDTISGAVNNDVKITKKGEACSRNILGLFAFGDSSVETARRMGGIKKVAFADTNYFNILGLYQKGCTIAKGQ